MADDREVLEREFEDLLIEVLSQDYDLGVRHSSDNLDRRRKGVATLDFEYHSNGSAQVKVLVTIQGVQGFSCMLPVDFSSSEGIQTSAEDCEGLALFLMEHLAEQREDLFAALAAGDVDYGRREDDLL